MPYEVKHNAPLVKLEDNGIAQVQIEKWTAESKLFTANAGQPGNLVLRLFSYPAWRAEVNGQVVDTDAQDSTGQMLVSRGNGSESRSRQFDPYLGSDYR